MAGRQAIDGDSARYTGSNPARITWPGYTAAESSQLISDPETAAVISTISLTEVAIKSSVNRILMGRESLTSLMADLKVTVLPFAERHALRLFDLPLHHTDPFDRMIIATALCENLPLVGGDEKFPAYKTEGLSLIWK